MKIHTTRFGDIETPDDDIISLPEGILGFVDSKTYVLLEHDSEGTPFKWLQSTNDPNLAFIVMDPHLVVDGYQVEFDDDMAEQIGSRKIDDAFAMMAIVNIPHDEPINMTVNVRAPIIVHIERRMGWQVILPNEDYPIRHRIFPESAEDGSTAAE
jgi:flagellar assembly factor FliW